MLAQNLEGFRFRANPEYELVLFDRLEPKEREMLGRLGEDPSNYGILRPREQGKLNIKAASRDVALLFLTLQQPGPLPRFVERSLGDQRDETVSQMVMDSILEIEANGRMLSGPEACAHFGSDDSALLPTNSLSALSLRALRYAQTLDITDATPLSVCLYLYNRLPATRSWCELLPDLTATERYLGIQGGSDSILDKAWVRIRTPEPAYPWLAWRSRKNPRGENLPSYKLYVSPACAALPQAFRAAGEAAVRYDAYHLKVGTNAYGLLRPDKLVAYFEEFGALREAAAWLGERLAGCPAHGVPFTAETSHGPLLSWGIDPPSEEHTVPWLQRESWRQRMTNMLAIALAQAKASATPNIQPWRFALERIRLEGIDVKTWSLSAFAPAAESFSA